MAYKPAARGYRGQMLMGPETTFGELPAAPKGWKIPFNTEALVISRNKNTVATLRGTRNPAEPFDGNTSVDGDLVVPVDTTTFGVWLMMLFGKPVSAAEQSLYKHTFSAGEELPSFWAEVLIATQTPLHKRSTGCKINTFALEAGGDGELVATLGLMAAKQTHEATAAVSAPVALPFNRLANFEATLKVDGQPTANVMNFSLSMENGLDGDVRLLGGQGFRADLPEGLMGLSGTMEALVTDNDFYTKALASTPLALELAFIKGTESLTIKLPQVQLQVTGPAVDGPAGMKMSWNWQAYSPQPDDAAMTVELVNTLENYDFA